MQLTLWGRDEEIMRQIKGKSFQKFIYMNKEDCESQLASHISYMLNEVIPWRSNLESTAKDYYCLDFIYQIRGALVLKEEKKIDKENLGLALEDLENKFSRINPASLSEDFSSTSAELDAGFLDAFWNLCISSTYLNEFNFVSPLGTCLRTPSIGISRI
ncbi:10528_t:CDS:2 [Dentiscutata erythropus]|uniref:10528_t:CDS:1 n=1 Tax=Dentiscutata erythropus TaxID=1348616 RepID=A0A9N9GW03_9GLOM|nr:10528_t:CDS:2 [Dentiscutata erythropus]